MTPVPITHTTVDPLEDEPTQLTECQSDHLIVGGPAAHTKLVGVLHTRYLNDTCVDSGICAAHFALTIAFIVNEQQDMTGPHALRSIAIEFAPVGYLDPIGYLDRHALPQRLVALGLDHPLTVWEDEFAGQHTS